ncbi:2OG-Fe(II) oxygenase [Thiohalocapsa marina]|uniref:2OG-Fe(II) oxygenase n=1 Tax=Thiohalocapsa marina TaxID=424902 RepID=UPI0036DE93F7
MPPTMLDALFIRITQLPDAALSRAGIGREQAHQLNRFVRQDDTRWLEPGNAVDAGFLDWIEAIRLGLNRRLFLGLFDYEAHYARYQPGAFYKKHLDAFDTASRNRVLSTVLYLNPNWPASNGGELLLYASDGEALLERVLPGFGRLAIFLSERFPHEVLPTRATRFSIAGWFRVNTSLQGAIDPAR